MEETSVGSQTLLKVMSNEIITARILGFLNCESVRNVELVSSDWKWAVDRAGQKPWKLLLQRNVASGLWTAVYKRLRNCICQSDYRQTCIAIDDYCKKMKCDWLNKQYAVKCWNEYADTVPFDSKYSNGFHCFANESLQLTMKNTNTGRKKEIYSVYLYTLNSHVAITFQRTGIILIWDLNTMKLVNHLSDLIGKVALEIQCNDSVLLVKVLSENGICWYLWQLSGPCQVIPGKPETISFAGNAPLVLLTDQFVVEIRHHSTETDIRLHSLHLPLTEVGQFTVPGNIYCLANCENGFLVVRSEVESDKGLVAEFRTINLLSKTMGPSLDLADPLFSRGFCKWESNSMFIACAHVGAREIDTLLWSYEDIVYHTGEEVPLRPTLRLKMPTGTGKFPGIRKYRRATDFAMNDSGFEVYHYHYQLNIIYMFFIVAFLLNFGHFLFWVLCSLRFDLIFPG